MGTKIENKRKVCFVFNLDEEIGEERQKLMDSIIREETPTFSRVERVDKKSSMDQLMVNVEKRATEEREYDIIVLSENIDPRAAYLYAWRIETVCMFYKQEDGSYQTY